jgi:hypothetical protein
VINVIVSDEFDNDFDGQSSIWLDADSPNISFYSEYRLLNGMKIKHYRVLAVLFGSFDILGTRDFKIRQSNIFISIVTDRVYSRNASRALKFSPGPPVSSTNTTDRHDITELLLNVALNTNKQTNKTNNFVDFTNNSF